MNINKQLLSLLLSLLSLSTFAQTTKKTLNYQAVILDPKAIDIPGATITGQPLNKGNVCLRFSLLNTQGGLDYEETQQVTTDEYGLVNVAIGAGTQAQAGNSASIYKSFESIVWNSGAKSLKVSVSFDGCANFIQVSTQALNYTPYALYAEAVDYKNVREAPTKLSQFSNDAGYLIPKDLDPIKSDIKSNTSQLATANQTIADNKKTSDAAFLLVNQSLTSLDKQVTENTRSITTIETKLVDQQNQIFDNRNQITATNNTMNAQIGGLQGQINSTNSTVSNLTGEAEMQSNKSTATNLGGANPSDQAYPSQRAAKAYVDLLVSQIATSGVPDATTLAPGKLQLAGDLGGTATNPTVPALATKENSNNKSTNVQTDAASDTKYPSVKAVKTYVDQATLGTALATDLANKANIASPAFTGTPTAPTPTSNDNSTKIATTAFVQAATSGIALQTSLDGKADKNSPTFTGTPVLPAETIGVTQTAGDNSTKLATTAYVATAVSAVSGNSGVPYTGATGAVNLGAYNLTVRDLTIGTGSGTGSGNTAFGYQSLNVNTANDNTAMGYLSLRLNSTGIENTANGNFSLANNTTGIRNTALGTGSLQTNQSGSKNTAVGGGSLYTNVGSDNTALGFGAGYNNTTGTNNTFIGRDADASVAALTNATAIGVMAKVATSNTIQLGNTDVANVKTSGTITAGDVTYPKTHGTTGQVLTTNGSGTLAWATASGGGSGVPYSGASQAVNLGTYDLTVNGLAIGSGKVGTSGSSSNTIVGGSGGNRTFTSAESNTAIGYNTLSSSAPGNNNTAVGAWSLVDNNNGLKNSAMGVGALQRNLGGNENTAIGYYALWANTSGSNNTVIGNAADISVDGLNNATAIGSGAKVAASNTIQLGNTSVTNVKTSGTITAGAITYPNTAGTNGQVLTTNGSGTATWASASSSSGVPYSGASQAVNLGGYDLTVNGLTIGTGYVNPANTYNTIVGRSALKRTSPGTDNTAIGYKAIGEDGFANAGDKNTAVGSWTLIYNSGIENSAIGVGALQQNQGGGQNTAMGNMALNINSSGSNNTALGYAADVSANNLSNATAIGNGAKVAASNTIQLGNTSVTNVKTSGTITAGDVTYPKTHGSANQVLSTTGSGTLAWTTPSSGGVTSVGAISGSSTANGANITSGVLNLAPADGSNGGVVTTGTQTFAGTKTFSNDIVVNGIIIGRRTDPGYGELATSYGVGALNSYVSGARGATAFGHNALEKNTSGAYNNAFGIGTLQNVTTGTANTAIGSYASVETSSGSSNVIIGHEAGRYLNTDDNTIIGYRAGQNCCTTNTTNIKNTYIGFGSGNGTTGSKNVIVGSYSGGTFNNNIILADGDGTWRYHWNGTTNNFNGTVSSSGNNLTSDLRLKSNISPLANSLATILQLNPVHYLKKSNLKSTNFEMEENGFIAQEIQKVLPFIVKEGTDKDKILSVDYNSIIPLLTKGIQEQQNTIQEQQNQINDLNKKMDQVLELLKTKK
jgi:predicted  nucleic acid-binding Zn-ribbon protein